MTDLELFAESIEDLARDLRPEIELLTAESLNWNPGPQANSIGVTLWHMARGMDFLAVRILQSRPAEDEQWHVKGWTEETGYDPRGIGYGGWGVVTGYTWEEVLAIPKFTAQESLGYFDGQTCFARVAVLCERRATPYRAERQSTWDGGVPAAESINL